MASSSSARRAASTWAARVVFQALHIGAVICPSVHQQVAGLDPLPSCTWMALTTATSLGWITLLLPLGTILPLAVATTSISPRQARAGPGGKGHHSTTG